MKKRPKLHTIATKETGKCKLYSFFIDKYFVHEKLEPYERNGRNNMKHIIPQKSTF